jgi:hypothetical protein
MNGGVHQSQCRVSVNLTKSTRAQLREIIKQLLHTTVSLSLDRVRRWLSAKTEVPEWSEDTNQSIAPLEIALKWRENEYRQWSTVKHPLNTTNINNRAWILTYRWVIHRDIRGRSSPKAAESLEGASAGHLDTCMDKSVDMYGRRDNTGKIGDTWCVENDTFYENCAFFAFSLLCNSVLVQLRLDANLTNCNTDKGSAHLLHQRSTWYEKLTYLFIIIIILILMITHHHHHCRYHTHDHTPSSSSSSSYHHHQHHHHHHHHHNHVIICVNEIHLFFIVLIYHRPRFHPLPLALILLQSYLLYHGG